MARRVIRKLSTIGRASRFEAFNPDAIDGDNDGIVQELTRFERPATARTISGAMSKPFDINQPVPEIIDALINDPSLYDLAPQKIPSVIFEMAGGNRELFERSRIRNVTPRGQWSEKRIMDLVNGIKIEPSPDGIFTIVAPPIPEIRELIGFDGDFSNVRIPSSEARIRMYKAILENLKENKNEKRAYAETISEKLYKKADNGMFLPRSEYKDMRESLGEQYMPGTPNHPFDAIYERFLRLSNDMMFGAEMYQMEYVQVMHDFYGHLGTGRGFDRHGEWANFLAMVHAAETVVEGDNEIIDQVAFEFFRRIMTNQLLSWEQVDERRGIKTAKEAINLILAIMDREDGTYIDRDTMRQIIGIDDPLTYSRPKTKSLSAEPKTIRERAVAYLHSIVDNNIVETGQTHSSFVKKKKASTVEEKSLRRFNRFDRFDPNAVDADDDGLVQEQTRFERPGLPRAPKTPRLTGAMARPRTMDERNKNIIERYNKGQTARQIAEEVGMTDTAVEGVLKVARKRGEVLRAPLTESVQGQQEAARKLFDEGKTYNEIGEELGLTRTQAYNLIRKYGEGRGKGRQQKRSIDKQKRTAKIIDMFDSGKTRREIREITGLSREQVDQTLRDNQRSFRKKPGQTKPEPQKGNNDRIRQILEERRVSQEVLESERLEPGKWRLETPVNTSVATATDGIPESDKKLLQDYDAGKTVVELAKERDTKPGDILKTLVKYRLPDEDGRMTVPRPSNKDNKKIPLSTGLKGSISSTPKPTKSMKDYVDKPQLDVDAETIANSIGFWGGWVASDENTGLQVVDARYNYTNHPQFSYDLQTGKPVSILGSRVDMNSEKIIREGRYVTPDGYGTFGNGASFAFDGDPLMGEVYSEDLGQTQTPGELERKTRLIVRLGLENPIVVNVGITDVDENTKSGKYFNDDANLPKEKRILTTLEASEVFIEQLGGEDKVRSLYQALLDYENGGDDTPAGIKLVPNTIDTSEQKVKRIKRYEKIINGGKIEITNMQEFNMLARANGHDGIVYLSTGAWGPNESHMIVLDDSKIEVLGTRPAYNKDTISNYEDELAKTIANRKPYDRDAEIRKNSRKLTGSIRREDRLSGSISRGNKKQRTEQNQKIVDSYNSGKTSADIAIEQNLPLRTVRYILTEERKKGNASSRGKNYTPAQALNPKIQERNQKIVDSYNSGKTRQEIADNEKIPLRTVNYVISEARKPFVEKEKLSRAPKYTERNQKIIDAYNSGKQPGEIAKEQNLPTRTVQYVLGEARKNNTITLRPSVPQPFSSRPNPEIVARNKRITDAYESGKKYQEIADSEKISLGYVTRIIFEYNKMLRDGRPSKNRQGRQADPEIKKRNKKIVDAYNSGLTYQEIADNENLTLRTVTYVIAEARKNKLSGGIRARSASPSVVPPQTSSARTNRRSKLPRVDTGTPARGEGIRTPGMITGSMANENKNVGRIIPTTTSIDSSDPKKVKVSIKYGEVEMPSFEADIDAYSEWKDTYQTWFGWIGNYGMRLASAALMGEPLPEAAGYWSGNSAHDIIQTGLPDEPDKFGRSDISRAGDYVRAAFIGLHHINSGKEINVRPIYRGISSVPSDNPFLNLSAGEIVTLPLSAFTSDLKEAKFWAMPNVIGLNRDMKERIATEREFIKGKKIDSAPGIILEILPGARTGDAAGDQYLHEFELDGELVTDVAEQLTQGRFKYVRTTTEFIEHDGKLRNIFNGERTKVTKITLEQVETFNPVTGKFEKNLGRSSKLSGSMGTKIQEDHLRRLGDIRQTTKGLVAQDMQTLRDRATQNYAQLNPEYVKRLALINSNENWKKDPAAVNPDGTPMSKAEYVAMVKAEQRMEAEIYVSKRLNNYAPDFNPLHLQQMQYNVEMMYLASPQMYVLAKAYGFPQFAILTAQEIIGKDGKPNFFPNSEVRAQKMPGEARGISLMHSGISAILPIDGSEFIPKGAKVNDALQNQALLLNGHWGVTPEFFINAFPDNPTSVITRYTEAVAARQMSKWPRPSIIDEGSPVTLLRHEASHITHNYALAKAKIDMQADPTNQTAKEAHVILSLLNKNSWQNAAAVDLQFVNMMLKDSVSDYAASSPPEWLAETLTAALSPSRVTRNLLSFNHRAILATAFPELSNYLTGSVWP